MPTFRLLAGPPASAFLWTEVLRRLRSLGHEAEAIELLEGAPTPATVLGLAQGLLDRKAVGSGEVLVAHGLAVPVARAVAARCALGGLVLSNGPLHGLDSVSRALQRLPGASLRMLMRPIFSQAILASSLGLRRTVINPYVMDRDTVVMLTAPWAGSAAGRRAAAELLADLPGEAPNAALGGVRTLLLWGDEDPLYPPFVADRMATEHPAVERRTIPGGDHFHPLERPWAFADLLAEVWPVERPAARATG